ncbi:MAG: zinc ribbon domain-containing protein [Christensenellales bacterium]
MFCTKCGKNIEDTSEFCIHCGAKMEGQPAQPQYAPAQTPAKKSNKGLIIGLVAGAAVIAIVLILVLVILPGGSSAVIGKWYDADGYGTIEFLSGGKCKKSTMGFEFDATYTFDAGSGKGKITMSFMGMTETTGFTLEDDNVLSAEDGTKYTKTPVEQKSFGDMFNLDDYDYGDTDIGDFNLDDYGDFDFSDFDFDWE